MDISIVVNIVTFVLGIGVGYFFYYIGKERKRIIYKTYTTNLIHDGISLIPELKILWEEKEIKNNLSITNYIFSNKGNKVIKPNDMSEPLSIISNNEDTIIWKAVIVKEKYKTSKFKVNQTNNNSVSIDFKHMELNDEIEIKVIHTGSSEFIKPIGRILGHGEIKSISEYYQKIQNGTISFLIGFFVSMFVIFIPKLNIGFIVDVIPSFIVTIISGFVAFVTLVCTIFSHRKSISLLKEEEKELKNKIFTYTISNRRE